MDSREPHAARIRQRMLLQTEIRNAILDDLILSGEIPTGEKLPSEAELCETYAASRVTVRSALQSLAEQGFIQTRRGSGSIVLPRAKTIASHLTRLVSFDTYADQAGESFETVDLIIEDCLASQSSPWSASRLDHRLRPGRGAGTRTARPRVRAHWIGARHSHRA